MLFADLKGSMELLADRDPEEARQLLDPVLERMMAAVHRYEGTVNQVMGDGIMALFGAPLAHEDHAVRACYAALGMQAAVQQYATEVQRTHGVPLQMRVGLNAGEVVVRAIGNDLHMDYSAIGQTTHLAARMEQMAMPGSILITPAVLGLAEGTCRSDRWDRCPSEGSTRQWRSSSWWGRVASGGACRRRRCGAHALCRPGHGTRGPGPGPGAGRGAGQGQVVAVVGEAGVGKSRLVYECVHSPRTQGWLVLESASVSYGKATPYFPVIDLLKRYVHVEDADEPRTIRAKVTGQVLTLDESLQETIPASSGCWMPCRTTARFAPLDPPQRRQRLLDALRRVLLRESQVQPLLLVFEDLHWIDTETQALLDRLVDSLPTTRILLLVNYRPEYQHGWSNKTTYTQLRLDPLPPASADEVLQALLGNDPSLDTAQAIPDRADRGQPLLPGGERAGTGGDWGSWSESEAPIVLRTPSRACRCQRPCRPSWRRASTACHRKRSACSRLLPSLAWKCPCHCQAIAEAPEESLQRSLAQLQAAEFLYETRLFPEHEYTLKHALTHEVAYGSLLLERRRVLHARIVPALEALAGDRVAEQVERLAHHALRGEVWDKALAYCRQAGRGRWRDRPTARPWGTSSRRSVPSSICRSSAIHSSRPSISGLPCARRSCRQATWGVSWRVYVRLRPSRRPSTTHVGSDRSPSFCHSISTSGRV